MTTHNNAYESEANPNVEPDWLARAYLDQMIVHNGGERRFLSSMEGRNPDPNVELLIDELGGDEHNSRSRVRPADALAAVFLGRAVQQHRGLAKRIRKDNTILCIEVSDVDLIGPVRDALKICALPTLVYRQRVASGGRHQLGTSDEYGQVVFFERDGADKRHTPNDGNDEVAHAIWEGSSIIGITPDARKCLPRDLVRAAEFTLSIGLADPEAISLVLEAYTGKRLAQPLDPDFAKMVTSTDLSLSVRNDRTPEECLQKLREVMVKKEEYLIPGPRIEELAGYGSAKRWALELIDDVAALKADKLAWDNFDHRGLLLSGPPGVGKTSFARALAKSANVPLIATSVAEWNCAVDHLGHTLQSMRQSFRRAAQTAPSILLIDELDGISSRDNLNDKYREYWLQIVNQLLELLEGSQQRRGVIVIGATNFPEKIDPAILRAGRLDREMTIKLPTVEEARDIFRFYLGDELAEEDLTPLALACAGRSGADIKAYVMRARADCRRSQSTIKIQTILDQIEGERSILSEDERRIVAIHESGHAIASIALDKDSIEHVKIDRRGGMMARLGDEKVLKNQSHAQQYLVMFLAGAAAEEEVFGKISLGSSGGDESDLVLATQFATQLEMSWCEFQDVPLSFSLDAQNLLLVNHELRERVQKRLNSAAESARALVRSKLQDIEKVAEALLQRHYLTGDDVRQVLNHSADVNEKHAA